MIIFLNFLLKFIITLIFRIAEVSPTVHKSVSTPTTRKYLNMMLLNQETSVDDIQIFMSSLTEDLDKLVKKL